ncbi:MAG: cyclic nucleotide-binding domain-containing protein [Leptolyngbya sp. Prado105]|jgi:hypothetical protein|nr:cyclic nucleotide-binding domain-containing protein [Leptolyngbya sp. Prado105]
MFAQLPERQMHLVRWVLTLGWLLVIASLFYDPWTAALTEPTHPWSPLRLTGECVPVQGTCLTEQPYPIGAILFWGAIVPSAILILLIFGHELWRRICPLSFLSQIPRALGWQRQFKRENQKTGKVRYELAKVSADSWLGKNYPYVQFGWLFAGLCGRILFFNADRVVLGLWLLFTIIAAISVGYFYGGKSWCQYFCPMAPVQTIFSEPRGLLGSKAHMSDSQITQSMCRTVEEGQEKSACVACQSPCIDIDSERTYWDGLNKPEESLIRYGYVGLVIGYFVYYYLYAGNWDYYFSGAWNRDPDQLASLMSPGLYLKGQAINIPKILAVPLVLGASSAIAYFMGKWIEQRLKAQLKLNPDLVKHRIFAICTFGIFNFFFFFAGRPLLRLMPYWVQASFDIVLVFLSTLWLQQAWRRSPDLYSRENLASRFRKQLAKMQIDVSQYLDGRSLDDLHTNEVYVLAKILPGFTREKRHEAYKGVVKEALEEGYVNYSSSLEVLKQMRQELGVSDDEHREVLEELGIEDPEILNPNRQRSLENQIRLTGYQKSLERLMRLQQQDGTTIRALNQVYSITPQEEEWIQSGLSPDAREKAAGLQARLSEWIECDRALNHPILRDHPEVLKVLKQTVQRRQDLIISELQKYNPQVTRSAQSDLSELSTQDTIGYLELLLTHYSPIVQATTLYAIAQLNRDRVKSLADTLEDSEPIVQNTAKKLPVSNLTELPDLEKLVYLSNSDFFYRIQPRTLIEIGNRSQVKLYSKGAVITEAGDTCRELLLLLEGDAEIHYSLENEVRVEHLHPGQILDELEILTHSSSENTIVAESEVTRILAVPIDAIDDLLDRDPDFARRVLELESRQLQRLVRA